MLEKYKKTRIIPPTEFVLVRIFRHHEEEKINIGMRKTKIYTQEDLEYCFSSESKSFFVTSENLFNRDPINNSYKK